MFELGIRFEDCIWHPPIKHGALVAREIYWERIWASTAIPSSILMYSIWQIPKTVGDAYIYIYIYLSRKRLDNGHCEHVSTWLKLGTWTFAMTNEDALLCQSRIEGRIWLKVRRGKSFSIVEVTSRWCGGCDWGTEEAYSGVRIDGLTITRGDTSLKAIAIS